MEFQWKPSLHSKAGVTKAEPQADARKAPLAKVAGKCMCAKLHSRVVGLCARMKNSIRVSGGHLNGGCEAPFTWVGASSASTLHSSEWSFVHEHKHPPFKRPLLAWVELHAWAQVHAACVSGVLRTSETTRHSYAKLHWCEWRACAPVICTSAHASTSHSLSYCAGPPSW